MIQYTFPAGKQPDTEEDSIALGFITTKSDAVLLRVESATTQDYMELEIVIAHFEDHLGQFVHYSHFDNLIFLNNFHTGRREYIHGIQCWLT